MLKSWVVNSVEASSGLCVYVEWYDDEKILLNEQNREEETSDNNSEEKSDDFRFMLTF